MPDIYDDWRQRLSERFPDRDRAAAEQEWAAVKQRLSHGQAVTGIVVAKAHFGAWLDIGVGFPALLQIIAIAGLTPDAYPNDWCPIGGEVTAMVGRFNESKREIGLWQVNSPGERFFREGERAD